MKTLCYKIMGLGLVLVSAVACSDTAEGSGTLESLTQALVPTPSLVGNWRLDEAACGISVNDASQTGARGTKYNGVGTRAGRIGSAAWFDGIDDRIEIPNLTAFNFTTAMTVSAWVNSETVNGNQTILNKWYGLDSYMLSIQSGRFNFTVVTPEKQQPKSYEVSTPATAKVWTHVAGVFDGSRILIYVNGSLRGTTTVPPGTVLQQSTRPVVIGNNPSWNAYKGLLDEVRLYNKALSATQVSALATSSAPTPVGYWRMEECSGTQQLLDASGNGRHGTKQNGVGVVTGGLGLAGRFDGADDVATIPDNAAFHMTRAMTVAAWVKPRGETGFTSILNKWYFDDSYNLGVDEKSFYFSIAVRDGNGQKSYDVFAENAVTGGQWTHVSGVFNGSSIMLYVNGQLKATTAVPANTELQQSIRPIAIGNNPPWSGFPGDIDEVRLYNVALSAAQVAGIADPAQGW